MDAWNFDARHKKILCAHCEQGLENYFLRNDERLLPRLRETGTARGIAGRAHGLGMSESLQLSSTPPDDPSESDECLVLVLIIGFGAYSVIFIIAGGLGNLH